MRLTRISLRGLLTFRHAQPVTVDLEQLGPGLVAVTGENGAGKTSLVEAIPAALYKELPSRESWYEYFSGRDAFVEAVFDDGGHEVKVRVQVDAERRTTERYLFVDGQSATTGRAKEADAEVLRRFGSYELFLASVLGSQKRNGNFLDAGKGERKARFVELLGLAHLERLHEVAKAERSKAELELAAARNDLGALQAQAALVPDLETAAAAAQTTADAAAHKLEVARTEEASAVAALERARGAQERLATLETAARAAERALGDARQGLTAAVDEEPRANRTAEQRRAALKHQDPDAQMERALERYAAATGAIAKRQADLAATLGERPALEAARKRAEELGQEAAALEAADQTWKAAEADLRVAQGDVAGKTRRVHDAQVVVDRDRARLENEASLLERVPCTAAETWVPIDIPSVSEGALVALAGTCPLLASARTAKDQAGAVKVDVSLATALEAAIAAEAAARQRLEEALTATDAFRLAEIRAEMPGLQVKAARLPHLEEARTNLQRLRDELEAAKADHSRSMKEIDELRARLEAERVSIEQDLQAAIASARTSVTAAQARLDAATAAADSSKAAHAKARKENDALSMTQAEASLSAARTERYNGDKELREKDQARAGAAAKLEQLRERLAALPALEAAARSAEQEVGDWTLLAQALGRDGIQALEIAAAGPEVARLTNELMAALCDTRWTIAFETLREKKSDRGSFSETFDIRAFDRGQERTVEGISGGERVIVGEALALALAIYNARKSGVEWRTLFRDETSGALSLANAAAYSDMLRRALALGPFHQIIFISHQPEVVERADARLVVAGGRVAVEGAPAPARAEAVA